MTSRTALVSELGITGGLCALFLAVASCLAPRSPAQQAADGAALYACVEKDWGQPLPTIAHDCTGDAIAVAEDVVADLEGLAEKRAPSAAERETIALAFPYKDNQEIMAKLSAKRASMAIAAPR